MAEVLNEAKGRTVLYRVLFHHFDRFLTEYETRLEREYGFFRPLLSRERLFFLEKEGKVGYRWGRDTADQETMNYLEFIARVTSHIPNKGRVAAIDIAARPAVFSRCE